MEISCLWVLNNTMYTKAYLYSKVIWYLCRHMQYLEMTWNRFSVYRPHQYLIRFKVHKGFLENGLRICMLISLNEISTYKTSKETHYSPIYGCILWSWEDHHINYTYVGFWLHSIFLLLLLSPEQNGMSTICLYFVAIKE